jgi:hypothetical protein
MRTAGRRGRVEPYPASALSLEQPQPQAGTLFVAWRVVNRFVQRFYQPVPSNETRMEKTGFFTFTGFPRRIRNHRGFPLVVPSDWAFEMAPILGTTTKNSGRISSV